MSPAEVYERASAPALPAAEQLGTAAGPRTRPGRSRRRVAASGRQAPTTCRRARPPVRRGTLGSLCAVALASGIGLVAGIGLLPGAALASATGPASRTSVTGSRTSVTAASSPAVSGSPSAGPPDVLTTPVRVAATSDGAVGYRELGSGSPLVLVTGYGATMDDWTASFVDGLAEHHRVVIFDNAGVGRTAGLPAPLTIAAMADQTSALIATLGLGRPAVLGWSMGGMTAQALAVLHPTQVSRLILAATQPGTGKSLPVPPAAAAKLDSSNPAVILSVLFPADEIAAAQRYGLAVLRFSPYYTVPAAVRFQQQLAVEGWLRGEDPAGVEESRIDVPTLVADGADDDLDPVANDRLLAATIHGAQLVVYAGASHAFWFQDERAFLARVEQFLS